LNKLQFCLEGNFDKMKMDPDSEVVFVCEHGAAKSVIAAAYFNRFAAQMGLGLHAVARGTDPDTELSRHTVQGLAEDGLAGIEAAPQKLTQTDLQSAQRVVTFCDLPAEYQQPTMVERWDHIPPVSENYEKARDAITERIRQMLNG
jgi:arsenate reductase (thioredoxin)